MKISVLCISKDDSLALFYDKFIKQCKHFNVSLRIYDLFPPQVTKAQKISAIEAQRSYTQTFLPYLCKHNYALHPQGKQINSMDFAKILEGKQEVCFFVGGAYGFEQDFLSCTQTISLSPLIFSHQIAKMVLCEQIYRGLSINANHPYHK